MAGAIFVGFHNQLLLTEYTVSNSRIPDGFDGYRIAVVSDLHAERFGEKQVNRFLEQEKQAQEEAFVSSLVVEGESGSTGGSTTSTGEK